MIFIIVESTNLAHYSLLGFLITFVNNLQFNLVVMFVYFVYQSSVTNLIYSKKLILLYNAMKLFTKNELDSLFPPSIMSIV